MSLFADALCNGVGLLCLRNPMNDRGSPQPKTRAGSARGATGEGRAAPNGARSGRAG